MGHILTRKGEKILVDDEDLQAVSRHTWRLNMEGYVTTKYLIINEGKKKWISLHIHRLIMQVGYGDKRIVDHINCNPLDNRRCNLRICDSVRSSQNIRINSRNTSGFKGVGYLKSDGKWQVRIRVNKKQKYLGRYETPEEAHEVYCLWADMCHGEFANYGYRAPASEGEQK